MRRRRIGFGHRRGPVARSKLLVDVLQVRLHGSVEPVKNAFKARSRLDLPELLSPAIAVKFPKSLTCADGRERNRSQAGLSSVASHPNSYF
jgi:hypothetical protein